MAKSESNNYSYMTHCIGAATYKVEVVFNEKGTGTMKDQFYGSFAMKFTQMQKV